MTPQEQISTMKKSIIQAIKVMGDRFGSTEQDVARTFQELKASMQDTSEPSRSAHTVLGPGSRLSHDERLQGPSATGDRCVNTSNGIAKLRYFLGREYSRWALAFHSRCECCLA